MSIEVKIPPVGESISSGIVSVWHKKSGEQVNAGDPLFTLETDKVSTEIVAEQAGILQTKVPEGQEVKSEEIIHFLKSKDYFAYGDTYINTIFVDRASWVGEV